MPLRFAWVALGLISAFLYIPLTVAATPEEVIKKLAVDCGLALSGSAPVDTNEFRRTLVEKLEAYSKLTEANREDMLSRLENFIDAEVRRDQVGSKSPEIAPNTLKHLRAAYSPEEGFGLANYSERMMAVNEVRTVLPEDPYFKWLAKQGNTDPVGFFLEPLNTSGPGHLDLAASLLRVRAYLDPNFPDISRGIVAIILNLTARKTLVTMDINNLNLDSAGAWDMARTVEEARILRSNILRSIPPNSPNALSMADYERLKKFLDLDNPDTEVLRRYALSVDGMLAGKIPADEMRFLKEESERLRAEVGLSDKIVFNQAFLSLWPSIWGKQLSYDYVLLRHFYEPKEDRQKIETQLRTLNHAINLSQIVNSTRSLNDHYNLQVEAERGRFLYLKSQ